MPQSCGEAIATGCGHRRRPRPALPPSPRCRRSRRDVRRRPFLLGDPAAGPFLVPVARRHRIHHIEPHGRVVLDAGVDALQPAVPPAQRLLQEADRRLGHGEMRIFVDPGADDALGRRGDARDQPRHGVLVGVAPAADGERRGLDRAKNPRRPSRASSRRRGVWCFSQTAGRNGSFSQPLEPHVAPRCRRRSPGPAGATNRRAWWRPSPCSR